MNHSTAILFDFKSVEESLTNHVEKAAYWPLSIRNAISSLSRMGP
jgi:hypothetical protein